MNSSISLKNLKAKLEKLLMEDADYDEIVNQSKMLDKYIQMQFAQMNKNQKRS